jgi:ubiquinol-cytochrome c reductase iron-sulfur subunit
MPDGHDQASSLNSAEIDLDAPQFQPAARNVPRMEKTVAIAFIVALLSFASFGGAYWQDASNYWLGGTLGLGMLAFGYGLVAWGKYLMPKGPFEEPRALMTVTKAEHDALAADFSSRGKLAIKRRSFILKFMGAAGGIFGIVALFPLLRSLGPLPKHQLYTTKWRKGSYVTKNDGTRVKADDVAVGAMLTVFPSDDVGSAISQTVLVRLQASGDIVTQPDRKTWGPEGFLAFSKVCTHAGCPVGLFEQATQQLLCPCHQSLFDLRAGALPIFGPAPRPLPQLPLYIDSDGYLRAQSGFNQPIGPGFWERGGTT